MMIYAALMGKDRLKEYAVGDPTNLFEEYLIICAIALVLTTIKTGMNYAKRDKD